MKSESHLALFAKFWRPGKVKTRLAVTLGNQPACQVYFEFLSHLIDQLGQAADRRTVVYSPASSQQEFSEVCGQRWELELQSAGDLGDRLGHFFSQALGGQTSLTATRPLRKLLALERTVRSWIGI